MGQVRHGRATTTHAVRAAIRRSQDSFTATVVANDGFETLQAFHASLATEAAEVAGRLYCRMSTASANASIVAGLDVADPLVTASVSPAIRNTLAQVASDPASPLAAGFDLDIE